MNKRERLLEQIKNAHLSIAEKMRQITRIEREIGYEKGMIRKWGKELGKKEERHDLRGNEKRR